MTAQRCSSTCQCTSGFFAAGHVVAAHELGAIQTLLITDSLFRINDVKQRTKYAALVEEVTKNGGYTVIFSGTQRGSSQPAVRIGRQCTTSLHSILVKLDTGCRRVRSAMQDLCSPLVLPLQECMPQGSSWTS